jgi:hypothetical protein
MAAGTIAQVILAPVPVVDWTTTVGAVV